MKFIHLTDIHLMPKGEILHELDPYDRLKACIKDVNCYHKDADLCVITGDLAHGANHQAYLDLKECLSHLRMPIHLLIGNHDRRDRLLAVFPNIPVDGSGFLQTYVNTSAGRFLILDTVEQGKGWGSYCTKRLDWLHEALNDSIDVPVYLFMHHPPFHVGIPSLDRLGLGSDGDKIGEALSIHSNIRHLFFGHVHRPIAGSWQGIPYSSLRGTNHQVPLDFKSIEVVPKSHEPPAYAIVFLENNQTTVHFHDYLDTYRVPYHKKSEGRPDWV
jgi:3',5'-cyclic AMP phosphodiesterase CpdA